MTLSKLKSLKSLNLMGAKLTDGGLKAIAGLENLEQLNLHGCEKIEGPGLQLLVQLKHLKELDLGHVLGERPCDLAGNRRRPAGGDALPDRLRGHAADLALPGPSLARPL